MSAKPRNPEAIRNDITALGRPAFNAFAGFATLRKPNLAIDAWRKANPGGDALYGALLEELEASERHWACVAHLERIGRQWESTSGLGPTTLRHLANPKDTDAMRAVRDWRSSDALWCLLLGGKGTGKTVATAWALREATMVGSRALLVPATKLARLATFDGEAETLAQVPWLAIDDVGTEHATDWGASVWGEILAERHERELRTIITSNLDAKALRGRLGERLGDRIASSCLVRGLRGDSMRSQTTHQGAVRDA